MSFLDLRTNNFLCITVIVFHKKLFHEFLHISLERMSKILILLYLSTSLPINVFKINGFDGQNFVYFKGCCLYSFI